MKYIYLSLTAAAVALFVSSCDTNAASGHDHRHEHETHHHHDNDDGHHGSEDEIVLSSDAAERFGVTTETVALAPFHDVLKVSGTILPSPTDAAIVAAPTSGIISFASGIDRGTKLSSGTIIATVKSSGISGGDQNQADKAAYEAARRELDRLKPLYDERLVTASEYNAALGAYEEAKATYSKAASSGIVSSPISGVITSIDVAQGQYVEVGSTVAKVSGSTRLTLRADVPERYYQHAASFKDAVIHTSYSDNQLTVSKAGGHRISSGQNVVANMPGYIPVYFSFDNDGSIVPGSNVEVYLRGTESTEVISVPISALSEQQGNMFVFVRLDEDCYRKVPVRAGRNDGDRVEILSGLNVGDEVVVTGATTVRIAESSGVVPEGHSHNH